MKSTLTVAVLLTLAAASSPAGARTNLLTPANGATIISASSTYGGNWGGAESGKWQHRYRRSFHGSLRV